MSIAAISLAALVLALAVSCVSSINIGFLALVLAWIVGVYIGGMGVEQVLSGFPAPLFLTLAGVTLLFAQAQTNGTLDRVARHAVRFCRGRLAAIPVMFFVLAAMLSAIGPGNIAATAVVAPLGMAAAGRYGLSPFAMAMLIAMGASAGSVSPVAPTGVIVNTLMAAMGLPDARWTIFLHNFAAHAAIALGGYLLVSVWPSARTARVAGSTMPPLDVEAPAPFAWRHRLTGLVIAALVVGTVLFDVNVGLAAFTGALILTLSRAADETSAIKAVPWGVIMMVTGMTVLIGVLERTGGMALFTSLLGRIVTPASVTAVSAFVTGLISLYSSTTGVVLPALLPTAPDLVTRMGGGDVMTIVSSMTIGGHLVDVSPLSTLGALCLAAAPPGTDTRRLFNQLMAWGLSMTIVGALVCWIFLS